MCKISDPEFIHISAAEVKKYACVFCDYYHRRLKTMKKI